MPTDYCTGTSKRTSSGSRVSVSTSTAAAGSRTMAVTCAAAARRSTKRGGSSGCGAGACTTSRSARAVGVPLARVPRAREGGEGHPAENGGVREGSCNGVAGSRSTAASAAGLPPELRPSFEKSFPNDCLCRDRPLTAGVGVGNGCGCPLFDPGFVEGSLMPFFVWGCFFLVFFPWLNLFFTSRSLFVRSLFCSQRFLWPFVFTHSLVAFAVRS